MKGTPKKTRLYFPSVCIWSQEIQDWKLKTAQTFV